VLRDNLAVVLPTIGNDAELADRLGVSRSSVCRWRTGATAPREEHLVAIAELAGVSPGDLRYVDLRPRYGTPVTGSPSELPGAGDGSGSSENATT